MITVYVVTFAQDGKTWHQPVANYSNGNIAPLADLQSLRVGRLRPQASGVIQSEATRVPQELMARILDLYQKVDSFLANRNEPELTKALFEWILLGPTTEFDQINRQVRDELDCFSKILLVVYGDRVNTIRQDLRELQETISVEA